MSERRRSRAPRAQTRERARTPRTDWMHSGEEAMRLSQREREEAARRRNSPRQPMRHYIKDVPDEVEVVVLDERWTDLKTFYEHNIYDPSNKSMNFEICVREFAECPVCQGYGVPGGKANYPSLTMFISVLVLKGFHAKGPDGHDVWVPYSRKLLPVKASQHPEFYDIFKIVEAKYGTIRGTVLRLKRNSDGDSKIGNIAPMTEGPNAGMTYDFMDEDALIDDFGHEEIKGRDGKVILQADEKLEPFDYLKIFPEPDPEDLRKRYNAPPTPGSRSDLEDDWEEEEEEESPRRSRTRRSRGEPAEETRGRSRRSRAEPHEEDEEEERPARTRRSRRAEPEPEPTRTRRSRRSEPEPEPSRTRGRRRPEPEEYDEPDDEEERPARRTRRREPEPEPDLYDDDIPF